MFLNGRSLQSSNISQISSGPKLWVPMYKIQRLQQNISSCPKEDVLDNKNHIRMMHDLLHKIDKSENMLATFTAYKFPQLTVLQSERPIKFMSVKAKQPLTWK